MAQYSTIVTDEGTPGIPLAGTIVSVTASTGQLATLTDDNGYALQNPITIGSLGVLEFNIPDPGDTLLMQYRYGGRLLREDSALVGEPPAFQGQAGAAANTFTNLTNLKGLNPTIYPSAILADSVNPPISYAYVAGNFTGVDDELNIVALTNVPLATGALVRQNASSVTYVPSVLGAKPRAVSAKLGDVTGTRDFGAVGNGTANDGAPVQAAIATTTPVGSAAAAAGVAFVPRGLYGISAPLTLYNYASIRGDNAYASKIVALPGMTGPLLTNQDPANQIITNYEKLGLVGGSYGIHITGATDRLIMRDLLITGQSVAGIAIDGYFQTSLVENVEMDSCGQGLLSRSGINNRLTLTQVSTLNMTDTSLYLNGCEDVIVEGHRAEGGGQAGKWTIDLDHTHALQFVGGYFENTHAGLIRASNSQGSVGFSGTHLTGSNAYMLNGQPSYQFSSDAAMTFHNCHATYPMWVSENSVFEGGRNYNFIPCTRHLVVNGEERRPAAATFDLLNIVRRVTTNSADNMTGLWGRLIVTLLVDRGSDGGVFTYGEYPFDINLGAQGGGTISFSRTALSMRGNGAGITLDVGLKSGATAGTATISATITGADPTNVALTVFAVGYRLEADQRASIFDNTFGVFAL